MSSATAVPVECSVRYKSLRNQRPSTTSSAGDSCDLPPPYASVVSNALPEAAPSVFIDSGRHPATASAENGLHIVQQVYQMPARRPSCKFWLFRFLLAIVAMLLAVALVIAVWHLLATMKDSEGKSKQAALDISDVSGSQQDPPELEEQSTSTESTTVSSPTNAASSMTLNTGSTKEQKCLKRCYDNVFLACACNQQCECPPKRAIDELHPKKHSGPFDFLDKLFNDDEAQEQDKPMKGVAVSGCVALCGPLFIPHPVTCDELLYSCD